MNEWLVNGQPNSFWMSGFFFPQGFMTGCLQTHARNYKIAIDKLSFSFQILPEEEPSEVEEPPEDGVYIYGLYMDGARWDREEHVIADQFPSEMYHKMPLIWFKPQEDYKPDPEEYSCPIYKTSVRAGVLSTTGQSTNFIVQVEIPTRELPRVWVLKAAAMLCQLND
jgi:dynein heavy chain